VAAEREWENEQLKRQLARDPDRLPENQQEWVHEREDLRSAVEGSDRAIAHLDRLWRKEREEVALQESNYNRINTKCGNLQQAQQRIQQENDTLQAALHRVEGERNQLTGEFVLTQNEQERLQKALNVQRKKVVLREKQILFGLYQYRHLQKKNAEQEQTIQQQRATIADLEQQAPEMVQEEALPAQNLSENEDCVVKPSPSSGWGFDGSHLTLGTLRYLVAPFYSPIATLVEDVQIP
jgi:chromosome segregation ATPase